VERLWPSGIRKDSLQLDAWLTEAAPGDALRRWFGHDAAKWDEFRRRYDAELSAELSANPSVWEPLLAAARQGAVELLYSSRDTGHNNAVALKRYLDRRLEHPDSCPPPGYRTCRS
jgi:uncharacterized protein YeaO (DUF488 family)